MDMLLRILKLSALVFCLLTGATYAAQWARVIAPKAVVYADSAMSSPIGFFSKDQKIRIGDKPKNKGQVVGTLYQGKVVYIKLADLATSKDIELIRSASERLKEREKKEASNETRFGGGASFFLATATNFRAVTPDQNFENSGVGLFMGGFNLVSMRRLGGQDNAIKVRVDYLYDSVKDSTALSLLTFTGEYLKDFYVRDQHRFSWIGGLSFSPWAYYEVGTLFKVNGFGAGFGGGVEWEYKIDRRMSIHVDGQYKYFKLFGFDLPESDTRDVKDEFSPSLFGPAFGASVTYRY